MTPENKSFSLIGIPNLRQPSADLVTGGAIDAASLNQAAKAGIRTVFDLRPRSEWTFDEAAAVKAHGMCFLHLPITGPQDLTLTNIRAFDALFAQGKSGPMLLHCASGNRVGAMMALRAGWLEGVSLDESMRIGREHGLTKMEPAVHGLLAGPRPPG